MTPSSAWSRALALPALVAMALATSCASDEPSGSRSPIITWAEKLVEFDTVSLSGPFKTRIEVGAPLGLDLKAPEDMREHIEVQIRDRRLSLRFTHDDDSWRPAERIEVDLKMPSLFEVTSEGSGDLTVVGARGDLLRISSEGAGSIRATDVRVGTLQVHVGGAARVDLDGAARSLDVDLAGAGAVQASDLVCEDVKVVLSGAGSAQVHATRAARGSMDGLGKIVVRGSPTERDIATNGIGAVLYE